MGRDSCGAAATAAAAYVPPDDILSTPCVCHRGRGGGEQQGSRTSSLHRRIAPFLGLFLSVVKCESQVGRAGKAGVKFGRYRLGKIG